MIEALRIFDHYHFRSHAKRTRRTATRWNSAPPSAPGETAWWLPFYEEAPKVWDRELFG